VVDGRGVAAHCEWQGEVALVVMPPYITRTPPSPSAQGKSL